MASRPSSSDRLAGSPRCGDAASSRRRRRPDRAASSSTTRPAPSRVLDRRGKRVDPLPGQRRDQHRPLLRRPALGEILQPRALVGVEPVDLVPDLDQRRCVFVVGDRCRAARSTSSTSCDCASASSCETSRTCRITSASITSSSVARKAATSMVGRSEMKPTVSDRMIARAVRQVDRAQRRIERGEQHVGGQHARRCVRRLNSVDLPALV